MTPRKNLSDYTHNLKINLQTKKTMTKKHFELIAQTLNAAHKNTHCKNVIEAIAFDLSEKFQAVNPNFDQTRFVEAVTQED